MYSYTYFYINFPKVDTKILQNYNMKVLMNESYIEAISSEI